MGLVDPSPSQRLVLVDASFLVSDYDRSEPGHDRCMRALDQVAGSLVTCDAVVVEAIYLLRKIPGAPESILQSIASRKLKIPFKISSSVREVMKLYQKYRDTPCDFADACLIQMADELNTGDIFTLDSDFRHYRWRKTKHFNLLIPPE